MRQNLISIIIPVFNSEKYVRETLESVVSQTISNWECIIVDDGSTDSSKRIAQEYTFKYDQFKYFYQPNSGPSAARNFGLEKSSGQYIQFLDSDDILMPQRLELMMKLSVDIQENVILYSNFLCGENLNIYNTQPFHRPVNIGRDITFDDMYRGFGLDFLFIPSCLFFNIRSLNGIKWNETLKHSEDWDYYLTILKKNYLFRYVDLPLVIYRDTEGSLSKNFVETIKANYNILGKWARNANMFFVAKRCALLYKKNVIYFILNKSNKIEKPSSYFRPKSLHNFLFLCILYPLTFFFLLLEGLRFLDNKRQNF